MGRGRRAIHAAGSKPAVSINQRYPLLATGALVVALMAGCDGSDDSSSVGSLAGAGGTAGSTTDGGGGKADGGAGAGGSAGKNSYSDNACDYFTMDIAKANVKSQVFLHDDGWTDTVCAYVDGSDKKVAGLVILNKDYPEEYAVHLFKSATYVDVEGSGATKAVLDKTGENCEGKYPTCSHVFFYVRGTVAGISVSEPGTLEENASKAVSIAKAVIPRLP